MKSTLNKIKFIFWEKYYYQILLFIVLGTILFFFFLSRRNSETINENAKFTIATIISEWHHKNNNGFGVDYEYFVKEKRYQKTVNLNVEKEQKFLIVFDSLNPRRSHLLTDYEISNTRRLKPQSMGWTYSQVPFSLDSVKITNEIKQTNAFTIFSP